MQIIKPVLAALILLFSIVASLSPSGQAKEGAETPVLDKRQPEHVELKGRLQFTDKSDKIRGGALEKGNTDNRGQNPPLRSGVQVGNHADLRPATSKGALEHPMETRSTYKGNPTSLVQGYFTWDRARVPWFRTHTLPDGTVVADSYVYNDPKFDIHAQKACEFLDSAAIYEYNALLAKGQKDNTTYSSAHKRATDAARQAVEELNKHLPNCKAQAGEGIADSASRMACETYYNLAVSYAFLGQDANVEAFVNRLIAARNPNYRSVRASFDAANILMAEGHFASAKLLLTRTLGSDQHESWGPWNNDPVYRARTLQLISQLGN